MAATDPAPGDDGSSKAEEIPQASRRAHFYRLEDNGAVSAAHRRRAAKDRKIADVVGRHRKAIERIREKQDRQPGFYIDDLGRRTFHSGPMPSDQAERLISRHEKAIRDHESGADAVGPAVRLIAPMTRRVAREDRRRARRQKAVGALEGTPVEPRPIFREKGRR